MILKDNQVDKDNQRHQEENIAVNSLKAWILASRPKTLTGAMVPVMIGLAISYADSHAEKPFQWLPAVLCLLFALVMQVVANFVNDYFDFQKGNDDNTRLGPKRACSTGWVTTHAMKKAILVSIVMACGMGLPLIFFGGLEMILIGLLCVLFCFLYTTHLSYLGLGDVLVLVFFGIVPVCICYYLQLNTITLQVILASVACGLVIDTLLMVNNYRDIENDIRSGKRTLAVRLGKSMSRIFYLLLGIVSCVMGGAFVFYGHLMAFFLPLLYLPLHVSTYKKMVKINHGEELDKVLGETARNMLIYGILLTVGMLW